MDEYEVRTWVGWYRYITLAMCVLAYLTVVRQHARQALQTAKKRAGPQEGGVPLAQAVDLLPLTVPVVRHVLWALVWQRPPGPTPVLRWPDWRRRHQARAKRSHIKHRQRRA